MADDVLVINHHQANLQVKDRVNAKGVVTGTRTFMTTTVKSEPITFMLDEGAVAKRAAEMLAQRIREQTEQITETVSAGAQAARRTAEKAFFAGKGWALKRYSGGRMGLIPPRVGENRLMNHSGRLAESIVAAFVKSTKEWRINFAANRWNPKDWPDIGTMQRAFQKWVDRVPVMQDASSDIGIRSAIKDTFADVVAKGQMDEGYRAAKLRAERALKVLQFAVRVVTG
jgi:hypothetical protein